MRGSLRRTPLMKMTVMTMTTMRIPRGWRLASTGSYDVYRRPTSLRRVRGLRKGHKAVTVMGAKRRHLLTAHVPIRPLPPPRVGPPFRHNLPKLLALAIGSRPLERGS